MFPFKREWSCFNYVIVFGDCDSFRYVQYTPHCSQADRDIYSSSWYKPILDQTASRTSMLTTDKHKNDYRNAKLYYLQPVFRTF